MPMHAEGTPMKIDTPDETAHATVPRESAPHSDETLTAAEARSEENIRLWTSYLPPDCVKTMIAMGWDYTT
jgi:hypothetical protein